MNRVVLKKDREKSVLRRHPWIFSGAIQSMPSAEPGTIFPIYSFEGDFLGQGYFNLHNSLCGRILSFEKKDIKLSIKEKIVHAVQLRAALFDANTTNAYRLINGEGDGLSGLIVDFYNGYIVLQVQTQGMEKLRDFICECLMEICAPHAIYEKSLSAARLQEDLPLKEQQLYGATPEYVDILENKLSFLVSIPNGQKTGFFLDQRSMRMKVEEIAYNKRVLNCFSYTGGFSLYALRGLAKSVTSIDSCKLACELVQKNIEKNGYLPNEIVQEDVFTYLAEQQSLPFELIILDPPAFAKKKSHLSNAVKAYQKLNAIAFAKMPKGSFLLTSSCSYFVDTMLFQRAIFQAALQAKRSVSILSHHIQASDHPISLDHPEGVYLKSLLLFVQ